jgi:hypothetical protein
MAGAASAHQAATASREDTSPQRAGRRQRISAEPQRAQQGATAAAADAPAALQTLSRLQHLADASPQVAQLRRLQALADGRFAPVAQLAGDPEEEVLVQGKFATAQRQPQLQQAPRANNTGLPDRLKSGIESLSGLSMDHVRVHYNSSQPAQLNALAYAQGSDIHLAPGQERHLPHEAWHVVQQAQGRVRPTTQMAGAAVNTDDQLEREADQMGRLASRTSQVSQPQVRTQSSGLGESCAAPQLSVLKPIRPWQRTVQRMDSAESSLSSAKSSEQGVTVKMPRHGAPREVVSKGSDELVNVLQPLLTKYLETIHYNSLEDAVGFVNYLDDLRKVDSSVTPQQAYESGMPVSSQALEGVSGSQCMGQGMQIAELINRELKLPAYPVAAKFPDSTGAGHGAAMLKFANPSHEDDKGVILLDPGFNVDKPLVIKANEPAKLRAFNYSLSENGSQVVSRDENKKEIVSFETVPVINSDESVSRTAMLYYKTFIVKARGNFTVVLQLNLRTGIIEVTVGRKKKTAQIAQHAEVTKLISNEVAEALGYGEKGADSLLTSLTTVIRSKDDILNLQNSKATIAK